MDAQTQRAPASQPGALGVLEAGAGHGAEGRDAEVEVSPAVVAWGVQRGGPEPVQDGEEPDASQARGGEEAPKPRGEAGSRPVCRPQVSPRDEVR